MSDNLWFFIYVSMRPLKRICVGTSLGLGGKENVVTRFVDA